VLLGESTVWNYYNEDNAGRSRFCDMDLLWEQAVYNMVKLICIGTDLNPVFHPFAGSTRLLLEDGARTIDPDIVVFSPLAPIVVDAKYSIASSANNADIYQMLAYLRSIDARCAVLVYLGDHEWTEVIGKDRDKLLVAVGLSNSDVRASAARTLSPHLTATVTSNGQR
jgi:5-methylcytosine-specific restriction endonuclease McrBC regulatory subunit McrC